MNWQPEILAYHSPEGRVCECCAPALAVGADGKVALMWRNSISGARDMYLAVSNDQGRTFSPAAKLGTGSWKLNACPMDGGGVAWGAGAVPEAVWRRETSVYVSAGEKEMRLDTNSLQPLIASTSKARLLLWEQNGDLVIQGQSARPAIFSRKGRAASLTALPDGVFAVAWEATGTASPGISFALARP